MVAIVTPSSKYTKCMIYNFCTMYISTETVYCVSSSLGNNAYSIVSEWNNMQTCYGVNQQPYENN